MITGVVSLTGWTEGTEGFLGVGATLGEAAAGAAGAGG